MGSIIDQIIPIAKSLDHPVSAPEMARIIYGEPTHNDIVNMHGRFKRLERQGYIRVKDRIRIDAKWVVTYEVIE